MLHKGTLFLSRAQRPVPTIALDGTFALTLLAIDRATAMPQPYLLIWTGVHAQNFWGWHIDDLADGAELAVELTSVRLHNTKRRPQVTQLLADVVSLRVVPPAPPVRKYLKSKQTVATADAGLAAIY